MDQGTHDTSPAIAWASDALRDVAAERRRQIEVEGWTPEHDDEHGDGAIAVAAACYAIANDPHLGGLKARDLWCWTGWDKRAFRPTNDRRNLVKAASLLLAEIERTDRAARGREQKAQKDLSEKRGVSDGRCDGLRPVLHGSVAVGGDPYRHVAGGEISSLTDRLWDSEEVMSLNAELGLTLDQLVRLGRAILKLNH